MKVTLNKKGDVYSVYVPKKDMEQIVVSIEQKGAWGGEFTLANGWVLEFETLDEVPALPKTMEARLLTRGE
ncbi:putative nitrogen fixation protein NifT [Seleniivibrio woodruffii]|uniref:putative nitrogen fixation protein NifT n=1 Tax=Seleniivibrio woodruffii TaxID=1078050 RepID=UPI0039E3EB44